MFGGYHTDCCGILRVAQGAVLLVLVDMTGHFTVCVRVLLASVLFSRVAGSFSAGSESQRVVTVEIFIILFFLSGFGIDHVCP